MNQQEGKQLLESKVNVNHQQVVIAKTYILQNFETSTTNILHHFTDAFHAQPPEKVVLHPSVPPESQIEQAAMAIVWRLAFAEAIWSLLGLGIIIPHSNLQVFGVSQEWTTYVRFWL